MSRRWAAPLAALAACAAGIALARCGGDDTSSCDDACIDVVPTPLAVAVTPEEIWVHPNDAPVLAVALTRGPGGDGDVAVTIDSDAGVVADPLTIPANSSTGNLVVHVPPSFSQGTTSITIDAQTSTALAQDSVIVHVAGSSGTLDTSFGSGGIADLSPSTGQDFAASMIVFQNGIVVGGTHVDLADGGATHTIKVLRLTNGGGADGTFAATSAPASVMSDLRSIAMLASGEIYAVGDLIDTKSEFAAVRVLAGGGLDPKYAVVTSISLGDDVAFAGAIEPGGNLVAAGSTNDASAIAVARYTQVPLPPPPDAGSDADTDADASDADMDADANTDASIDADASPDAASPITSHLDPSFADGGVLSVALSKPSASASSLLIAPDGSLYVLGRQSDATPSTDVAFLHVTAAGAVDTTVTLPLTSGQTGAAGALLDPDGTILVASDDGGQALVMRLLASGALDASFGAGGRAALAFGSQSAASAVTRDPSSGNILIGGASGSQCLVARLTPAGALDATFASAGSISITQGDTCTIVAIGIDDGGLIDVLENVTTGGTSHMSVARYWP